MRVKGPVLIIALALIGGCHRQPGATEAARPDARADPDANFWKGLAGIHFTEDRSHAGDPLPAEALADATGQPTSLHALRGKPVLVNFWAHWCQPCRAEMPTLNQAADARAGKLTFVAVNEDALRADGASPGQPPMGRTIVRLNDKAAALGRKIATGGLPTTVLYGSDGLEKWRLLGVLDWTKPQATKLLAEAI